MIEYLLMLFCSNVPIGVLIVGTVYTKKTNFLLLLIPFGWVIFINRL
jgi:hypothetical protein